MASATPDKEPTPILAASDKDKEDNGEIELLLFDFIPLIIFFIFN